MTKDIKLETMLDAPQKERELPNPSARIQWKGTDVCMDAYCDCGEHFHIDGDFAYFVKCPTCESTLATGCRIELIKVSSDDDELTPLIGFV